MKPAPAPGSTSTVAAEPAPAGPLSCTQPGTTVSAVVRLIVSIVMDGGTVLTVTVTGVVSVWTRPSQSSATVLRTYVPAAGGVQSQLQVVSLTPPLAQLKVWTGDPSTLRVSCLRYPSALAAPCSVVAPSDGIMLPLVGVSTSESMTVGT